MIEQLCLARIDEELVAIIAVGGGLSVAALWILASTISGVVRSRHLEESRREISAYVAEGSISAEEGERLLKARPKPPYGGNSA